MFQAGFSVSIKHRVRVKEEKQRTLTSLQQCKIPINSRFKALKYSALKQL